MALKKYQMFIDGAWVNAEGDATFESANPTTGEAWALIPEASEQDVDKAVQAAHRAFYEGEWGKMLPTQRGKYLRKLADLLADNAEKLGRTETIDSGKLFKETKWQAKYIAEFFNFYAGCADKISGETLPLDRADIFRDDNARTAWCGRGNRAVEFAIIFSRCQIRTRFGGRQHSGA